MTDQSAASAQPPSGMRTIDSIESVSVDQLRSLQLVRLQRTLRHGYDNVAHYREAFAAAGAHPNDLKSFEDLAGFPLLTKDDLRRNYPFGMFAVPLSKIVRLHASSGTTGKPTVVGYTKMDIATWSRVMARSIYAAGGRPGDMAHIAYGYGLFTGGLGAHYGAELLGCTVVPVSGGQTERQVTLIRDFRPRIILVTPSYCLNLIDEMERQGMDPAGCSLEIGIFGAEPWTDELRDELEARLGIVALDVYGLSEVIGPGVAQECIETQDGPTLWEDQFFPEIIHPDTGAALPDGEFGELVLTTLTREALPVIRYRTRDLTRLLPGTARPMRRIERITGRSDDMLIVRGVNVFPSQIEAEVMKVGGLSPHFQIELGTTGNLTTITVHVEPQDGAHLDIDATCAVLTRHIKDNIGVTAQIVLRQPGSLPRSLGKAQRVIRSATA